MAALNPPQAQARQTWHREEQPPPPQAPGISREEAMDACRVRQERELEEGASKKCRAPAPFILSLVC